MTQRVVVSPTWVFCYSSCCKASLAIAAAMATMHAAVVAAIRTIGLLENAKL